MAGSMILLIGSSVACYVRMCLVVVSESRILAYFHSESMIWIAMTYVLELIDDLVWVI